MEHESFEDLETAEFLNEHYVSIKVDKEERTDIDSVYMRVCQAMTGSGGWPLTIFMTPDKKPFYAGTYFPNRSRRGYPGFMDLLEIISEQWNIQRAELLEASEKITLHAQSIDLPVKKPETRLELLPEKCVARLKAAFDETHGGFGKAPKFPTPHNLIFLLDYYRKLQDPACLRMTEKTLIQMYKGGIFDHIGYGFSRYSTDRQWLAPHFEKMLYDNALLLMTYTQAFMETNISFYKDVAYKIIEYVFRELTTPEGGFYSAQDADSDGEEGKYYVFTPDEIIKALGEDSGRQFNALYNITAEGNFEGRNIPNLLKCPNPSSVGPDSETLAILRAFRASRAALHKDDKILTAWNGLMIAALAGAYKAFGDDALLAAAEKAVEYLEKILADGGWLYASFRNGRRGNIGFLDDYACYSLALIELYEATLNDIYLERATQLCEMSVREFYDNGQGGFHLYGKSSEKLLFAPKETYDGAMPSGNSVMSWNLLMLSKLSADKQWERLAEEQIVFMTEQSAGYPEGHCFFMKALMLRLYPPKEIVCVLNDAGDLDKTRAALPKDSIIRVMPQPTDMYPLKNSRTTFYVCEGNRCLPPVNELC